MDNFEILNPRTKIKVDLNEVLFYRILQLTYSRDKRLYNILKSKYEQLTQHEVSDEKMILENM